MISLRPASPEDMPFIKECIERFRLDDEDLDYHQFVVAIDGKKIAGFGRICRSILKGLALEKQSLALKNLLRNSEGSAYQIVVKVL